MRAFAQLRAFGRSRASVHAALWLLAACPLATLEADEPPVAATASPVGTVSGVGGEAPQGNDTGDADSASEPLSGPTRSQTRVAFDAFVGDKQYSEAATQGKRLVDLTAAEFGKNSLEVAKVLTELGDVQRQLDEHEDAEQTFMRALDIVRKAEGQFSPDLIQPMVGLGTNYEDTRDYLNALSIFNEARSINRRAYGILNEAQVPIMDRMSETLYKMDRRDEADAMQLDELRIAERTQGTDSIELLDALYKYAEWLRDFNRLREERQVYSRAMQIIRDKRGDTSPLLARPLLGFGNSLRLQRVEDGAGLSSLRRALEILEAQDEPDPLAIATALRDIGDWKAAFTRIGVEGDEYRRAWQELGELEDADAVRRKWFQDTVDYVLFEPIDQSDVSNAPDSMPGHVLVRFDLDESGRPLNVQVRESEPPGLKDEDVVRSLTRSRFRPHMQDGQIVAAPGLALNFTYRYEPDQESDQGNGDDQGK